MAACPDTRPRGRPAGRPTGSRRREAGSAAAELTLLTPLLVLLLLFVIAVGRLVDARLEVDSAARQAARAASAVRDPATAVNRARATATAALAGRGATCRDLAVRVNTTAFHPGGHVTVRMACSVAFGDLALLRMPGQRMVDARFTSPIDVHRSDLR